MVINAGAERWQRNLAFIVFVGEQKKTEYFRLFFSAVTRHYTNITIKTENIVDRFKMNNRIRIITRRIVRDTYLLWIFVIRRIARSARGNRRFPTKKTESDFVRTYKSLYVPGSLTDVGNFCRRRFYLKSKANPCRLNQQVFIICFVFYSPAAGRARCTMKTAIILYRSLKFRERRRVTRRRLMAKIRQRLITANENRIKTPAVYFFTYSFIFAPIIGNKITVAPNPPRQLDQDAVNRC